MFNLREFHIDSLTLHSFDGSDHTYSFAPGINYIQGPNSSGKTEFFIFLDYMLGRQVEGIEDRPWYSETLKAATLRFTLGFSSYEASRSLDGKKFAFKRDDHTEPARNINDYREKLNSAFCSSLSAMSAMRYFTEQELTYRTFSMFSFCEDTGVGKLNRFFTKLSELKYSVKERPLFDYLFNRSTDKIVGAQRDILQLEKSIQELEDRSHRNDYCSELINARLAALGIVAKFDGTNADLIMNLPTPNGTERPPSNMELSSKIGESVDYLEKQISEMEFLAAEQHQIRRQNTNRIKMLSALEELVRNRPEYFSITESTMRLLKDLKSSISLRDDAIYKELIRKKKEQLKELKRQTAVADAAYSQPSYSDSQTHIAIIKDCLEKFDPTHSADMLISLREQLKDARHNLRILRLDTDQEKVKFISEHATSFYRSTACVGGFSDEDVYLEDLQIEYIKEGNTLQPIIVRTNQAEAVYTGSRARHALIQIAGYYAFMLFLCRGNTTPTIPFIAFDHASSPFDDNNIKCIGALLASFYKAVPKESVQTFLFENRSPNQLGIDPDKHIKLKDGTKTGFNPFFSGGN